MIEEFSHQPEAEEDETPPKESKRFLKGTFLESWFKKSEEKESQEPKDEDEEEENQTESVSKRIIDYFKNLIGLELVPVTDEEVGEVENEIEYDFGEETPTERILPEVDTNQIEEESHSDEDFQGLLVVKHEQTILNANNLINPTLSYEITPTQNESSREQNNKYTSPEKNEKYNVYSAGEVLKKDKEELLSRKLKKDVKTIEHERKEIIKQQKRFEKYLDDRIKAESEKSIQETIENDAGLATAVPTESESNAKKAQSTEVEKLKDFVSNEEIKNPEVVLSKVEDAAEKDVPIEELFEKRHEIKGESAQKDNYSGLGATSKLPAKSRSYLYPVRSKDLNGAKEPQKTSKSGFSVKDQDMYVQAAKNGFWAAIFVLILMFFAYVLF